MKQIKLFDYNVTLRPVRLTAVAVQICTKDYAYVSVFLPFLSSKHNACAVL